MAEINGEYIDIEHYDEEISEGDEYYDEETFLNNEEITNDIENNEDQEDDIDDYNTKILRFISDNNLTPLDKTILMKYSDNDMENGEIYLIRNLINNKCYIGQARCLSSASKKNWGTLGRWKSHLSDAHSRSSLDRCKKLNYQDQK